MSAPRILFVLGKGGVGRSTVSAALGLAAARRGERTLIFGWTVADPIAPWFGKPPAGATPVELAKNLSVSTYSLDEALRAYFVDHLHLPRFHRRVVRSAGVRALVDAAPGIAELLFLGTLWWLTTLAPSEAGLEFDRVIVDAPATGHGASILDLPATLRGVRAAGLLGREIERVTEMMRDPRWSGAAVVSTPEELAVEETRELVPRIEAALGRGPLVAYVNRSVGRSARGSAPAIASTLSPPTNEALALLWEELRERARGEQRLAQLLAGLSVVGLEDQLVAHGLAAPRAVVEALSGVLR